MWSSSAGGGTGALRNRVEDQVRPGNLERARRTVDPLDREVRPDHDERASRAPPLLVVEAIGLADGALRVEVGEQRDTNPELLLEGVVGIRGVDGDAIHLHALGLELAEDLVVDVQLVCADRAEVERVEGEDGALAAQILE